jgi:hypothetical protein
MTSAWAAPFPACLHAPGADGLTGTASFRMRGALMRRRSWRRSRRRPSRPARRPQAGRRRWPRRQARVRAPVRAGSATTRWHTLCVHTAHCSAVADDGGFCRRAWFSRCAPGGSRWTAWRWRRRPIPITSPSQTAPWTCTGAARREGGWGCAHTACRGGRAHLHTMVQAAVHSAPVVANASSFAGTRDRTARDGPGGTGFGIGGEDDGYGIGYDSDDDGGYSKGAGKRAARDGDDDGDGDAPGAGAGPSTGGGAGRGGPRRGMSEKQKLNRDLDKINQVRPHGRVITMPACAHTHTHTHTQSLIESRISLASDHPRPVPTAGFGPGQEGGEAAADRCRCGMRWACVYSLGTRDWAQLCSISVMQWQRRWRLATHANCLRMLRRMANSSCLSPLLPWLILARRAVSVSMYPAPFLSSASITLT